MQEIFVLLGLHSEPPVLQGISVVLHRSVFHVILQQHTALLDLPPSNPVLRGFIAQVHQRRLLVLQAPTVA